MEQAARHHFQEPLLWTTDPRQVHLLDLLDYDFTMPFSLITKKGRKLSVHEQLFKHLMLDCYRQP